MEPTLSQEELDQLLQTLLPGAAEPEPVRIRPYDFKRPGKFAKDQVRTLAMLHENFARLMTGFFAASLRTRVEISVRSVNQFSYAEFIQGAVNPTVLGTFRLPPLPGTCVIEMSPNISLAIVDRVFGGAAAEAPPLRPLTEIEMAVMRRVFQQAMSSLQEAWQHVAEVRPELEAMETNPLFLQVAAPNDVLAVINLTVSVGEQMGHLALALPYMTVEPVLTRLSSHAWLAGARGASPEDAGALRRQVEAAPVEVVVQLGRVGLKVREFVRLRPGDVVVLDQPVAGDLLVLVDDRPAFYGRPGMVGTRMAVEVRRPAR